MANKDQSVKLRSNSKTRSNSSSREMSVAQLADVMKSQMEKLGETLTDRMDKVKLDLAADIEKLREENKMALKEFASSLDDIKADTTQALDAGRRLNDLIVSGVPYVQGENLNTYFCTWCRSLGYSENSYPLVDIRRLANNITNGSSPIILIQFAITVQRNDFYSAYLRSRTLSTHQIGFTAKKRIYINENLGITAREIRAKALKLKKEGKLRGVFTRDGVVYIRKLNAERDTAVRNAAELAGL